MSFIINKITDLIRTKVYVEKGPLEQSSGSKTVLGKCNHIKESESEKPKISNEGMISITTTENEDNTSGIKKSNKIDFKEFLRINFNVKFFLM
jgi:hypothetical protein